MPHDKVMFSIFLLDGLIKQFHPQTLYLIKIMTTVTMADDIYDVVGRAGGGGGE